MPIRNDTSAPTRPLGDPNFFSTLLALSLIQVGVALVVWYLAWWLGPEVQRLHRTLRRRLSPSLVVPAVPELPTAKDQEEARRASVFAGCAVRAILPEIPELPADPALVGIAPRPRQQVSRPVPLAIAALGSILLFACASPVPVKRTLVVRTPGDYVLTLVFPGLQAHAAAPLLQADGAATCERLGTETSTTDLVSTEEETVPPKDGGTEPRSTTTITGTLQCGGVR